MRLLFKMVTPFLLAQTSAYLTDEIIVAVKPERAEMGPLVAWKGIRKKDKAKKRKGPSVRVEAVVTAIRTSSLSIELLCFATVCIMVELPLAYVTETLFVAYDKTEDKGNFWIVLLGAVIVWAMIINKII